MDRIRKESSKMKKRVSLLLMALVMVSFQFIGMDMSFAAESNETDTITITVHVSSRDGDDFVAPVTINDVVRGSTYSQNSSAINSSFGSTITASGTRYTLYAAWNTKHSFSSYSSASQAMGDRFTGSDVLNGDTDVYVPYTMQVKAEITVEAPLCGSTDGPKVTVPDGKKWYASTASGFPYWNRSASNPGRYEGDIVGGNDYYFYDVINLTDGYTSGDTSTVKVNGGEFVTNWMYGNRYGFFGKVTAVHDPGDPVITNVVEPTCTEEGSHDEAVLCKGCGAQISSEKVTDPALGHDWGEWVVTTPATATEEGVETRTCKRDASHQETRAIPTVSPEEEQETSAASPKQAAVSDPKTDAAETGDDFNMALWFVCLCVSCVGMLVLSRKMTAQK